MTSRRETPFPTRNALWRGALLGTIVHALWQASSAEFAPDQQWDGPNYGLNNEQGARGTITFARDRVVGVFCDIHSSRNPWRSATDYHLQPLLRGMPLELRDLAEHQALRYQLYDYRGATRPIITAAFWSDGEQLTAAEPWCDVFDNGAHLVRLQIMEPEAAMPEWQEEYELSTVQMEVVRSLFERRLTNSGIRIPVEAQERSILVAEGDEGIGLSRDLLAAIGIILD